MSNTEHHPASFKDPSGFVFQRNNIFYRQINQSYKDDYDVLMSSGLYQDLIDKKFLLAHEEIHENFTGSAGWYKTILPQQLSFINYPYEWCFGQLKDAALLTLSIQKLAIKHGMILKDATHFNVQFHNGTPVFIDTLSFEKYDSSQPWVAYRQFCECFLFPLLLQKYTTLDVQKLMLAYPEGIPAGITKELLPWKSNFNLGVGLHVSLPGKIKGDNNSKGYKGKFDQKKMLQLVDNLKENIKGCLPNKKDKSIWNNYYDETIISKNYLTEKENIFRKLISEVEFKSVLDIGANDGFFSKIISEKAIPVVSIDFDSSCINNLYSYIKEKRLLNILPLCIDFANPTPAIGFNNKERSSFPARAHFDLVLALALIHHLAISKNIPLQNIAESFRGIANKVIVEFIAKEDEKVKQLLQNRKDIFPDYNEDGFIKAFDKYFTIISTSKIPGTHRTMYLLNRKEN